MKSSIRSILVAAFVVGLLVSLAGPAAASVSFFDVFTEISLAGPAQPAVTGSSGQYEFGPGGTDTIIQRISDAATAIDGSQVTADYPINSFFDIFSSVDGSLVSQVPLAGTLIVQFTLPSSWDPSQPPPPGGTGTTPFAAAVSMSLTGSEADGTSISVNSTTGSGTVAVQDTGGGTFLITSFFDIFTEVSLDNGNGIPLNSGGSDGKGDFPVTGSESSTPEPATIIIWSLLGALAISLGWRRRWKAV
jgi:hypothetical protein